MSVDDPATSLALVGAASRRLAGRGRRLRRYYVLQAAYWLVAVLFLLIFPSASGGYSILVAVGVILGLSFVIDWWADRRGVVLRGSRRLRGISGGATFLLYAGVFSLGLARFPGEPTFWIPAAVLTATPSLVAAVLAGRAADPR